MVFVVFAGNKQQGMEEASPDVVWMVQLKLLIPEVDLVSMEVSYRLMVDTVGMVQAWVGHL